MTVLPIDRRAMIGGSVATLFGLWLPRGAVAAPPASELDRIASLVGDSGGYIDAALHAQFRAEVAKIAPDGDSEGEVARYAASFGDLALHKAHSEALWESAERSLAEQRVVRTGGLDAVEAAIRASEARTGRTRLTLYLEQTPKMLEAAAKGSWTTLDGRHHVFVSDEIATMRGSVESRMHRLAALFSLTFPPPKRRWIVPGCPVGFESEVAVSNGRNDQPSVYTDYRARITETAYLAASISTRGWRDPEDVVLRQNMELDLLQAKGKLVSDPDRSAFRGNPSLRYLIEGTTTVYPFRAGRTWLIPQRNIQAYVSVWSTAAATEATAWLDHMEAALVLV